MQIGTLVDLDFGPMARLNAAVVLVSACVRD